MKKILLLLCGLTTILFNFSCSVTQSAAEIQRDESLHQQAVQAIREGDFVLETNRLQFRRGNVANVMNNTNFISLTDGTFTVQTSLNQSWPGPNNLGGVTLDATPRNIKIETDRNGNLRCTMDVSGAILTGSVEILVYAGSNQATATIFPTFSSSRLTLYGEIVPAEESRVFKGNSF